MATNHLALSDEDFMNQPVPEMEPASSVEAPSTETKSENTEAPVEEQKVEEKAPEAEAPAVVEEPAKELTPAEQAAENIRLAAEKTAASEEKKTEEGTPSGSEAKPASAAGEPAPVAETPPNYEEEYKKMLAPFTANGKTITPKNPEELIQLAQMGANYTRKLQELAPQRKILTMLGNHDLLDENKLSFLIALDKKDPEAIKKLIMDSGIDPLDIDTKIEPAYQEGSHLVSDQEVNFRTHLDEMTSTDVGKQTLLDIEKTWDQASKDMLWQHPQVMSIIRDQRENGVYAKITEEMDRQRILGQISPTTSFLEAYKIVGDQLYAGNQDAPGNGTQAGGGKTGEPAAPGASAQQPAPVKQEPVIVTTRVAAPKATVDNGDKAGAASPTRTVPGKAKEAVNFFAMSDDDFLKASNLQGRI